MKKIFTVLMLGPLFHVHADSWLQVSSFPGIGRGHPFSFSIGNKGYMGGGDIGSDDFWEFDPLMNTWTQKANYGGGAVNSAVGFSIGIKGYGATGNFGNELWEYDTALNVWVQKANFPGPGRNYAAGFSIGDKGYIGGGFLGYLNDFWEWDQQTDVWTQKSNLPSGISYSVGFSINDKGYFCTGSNGSFNLNITWEYDAVTDSWTQKANFPGTARIDAASFVICEKAYVGLGGELPYFNDIWQFDPVQNQWTQKTAFPGTVRDDAVFFAIGNKGYMGLGQYNNSINYTDFWEYTPDSACSALPLSMFTAPNQICPGTCINFTNQSTDAVSYEWSFPGANPATSTDLNPLNICYSTPGSYDVQLIASNTSGSDTLFLPDYISVFPNPPPQGITQSGDTLFASAGAVTYQWYFNGNMINGATGYFYIAQSSGNYNVVAADSNGCEVEAVIFDVIADVTFVPSAPIKVFIDPVLKLIYLKGLTPGEIIQIWNQAGTEVLHVVSPSTHIEIPTGNFAAGVFIVRISRKNKSFVTKFIMEN